MLQLLLTIWASLVLFGLLRKDKFSNIYGCHDTLKQNSHLPVKLYNKNN